jgi:hypothetical protein
LDTIIKTSKIPLVALPYYKEAKKVEIENKEEKSLGI